MFCHRPKNNEIVSGVSCAVTVAVNLSILHVCLVNTCDLKYLSMTLMYFCLSALFSVCYVGES